MKVEPDKFHLNSTKEAEISGEAFNQASYISWAEWLNPNNNKYEIDGEIFVEITQVYSLRMDVNISVTEKSTPGPKVLYVESVNKVEKFNDSIDIIP